MSAQTLTLVELNCENLFDTRHDEGKEDMEFLPDGSRHWTRTRYWRKLNHIGQTILACADELPDLVALCEVENDSVMRDLTRRSLLRNAGYGYFMTDSPDKRGLDVALLYLPSSFRPLCYDVIPIPPLRGMRPTRDVLYVKGLTLVADTLHLFVVHSPSRRSGEVQTRSHRMQVVQALKRFISQLGPDSHVLVTGDFNDEATSASLKELVTLPLVNITSTAKGLNGSASGTYRHEGLWSSLDHVLVSPALQAKVKSAHIVDAAFLLESDSRYGGLRPFRTYRGYHYQQGFSDHLPLVVKFLVP